MRYKVKGSDPERIVEKVKCLSDESEYNKRWLCVDHNQKCHPCYNDSELIPLENN